MLKRGIVDYVRRIKSKVSYRFQSGQIQNKKSLIKAGGFCVFFIPLFQAAGCKNDYKTQKMCVLLLRLFYFGG